MFEQLETDTWPHLVVLQDGWWFLGKRLEECEAEHGSNWMVFDMASTDDWCTGPAEKVRLDPNKSLGEATLLRKIVVNRESIIWWAAYDS